MKNGNHNPQPYAVVIGLDCITGLQSARILRRRGVPVIGIAGDTDHPCCRTRVCEEVLQADLAGEGLIGELERLALRLERPAVLFPCTDLSVLVLSRHRDRLSSRFRIAMPPHETVVTLLDKIEFFELARRQGFAVPAGVIVRGPEDAREAVRTLRFPCIVKPSVKTPAWQVNTRAKVYKVHDGDELLRVVDRCLGWTSGLLVQEWVPGGDENCYTCNCYLDASGKAVVSYVSRKVRQWPPQTGIGCLSVASRNEVVRRETVRLFEGVRFHGLGYAEFKVDRRTGEHFIIEPNVARPTGRSAMAESGGVELLYTMYRDALGEPLPAGLCQDDRPVKWIHLRQDVRSAWVSWRAGQLTLRAWWASIRGPRTYAIFSWSDPRPFLSDLWKVARRAAGRGRRIQHGRVA